MRYTGAVGDVVRGVNHEPGEPDDRRLLERIASGEEAAFERFYRRHLNDVLSYAARQCRDAHEVAELSAAVFVSVWQSAASFDPERGTAGAWLRGIAANRLIDLRRSDGRRQAMAARIAARRVLEPHDIDRLTRRIDAERDAAPVIDAVRALPDAQRDVISLVAIDGLNATEAADRLGTSPTAVRMRLARARRSVRDALGLEADTGTGAHPSTSPNDDAAEALH